MIMKKIFIAVCIIAALYLMAQTSFAKNLLTHAFQSEATNYEAMHKQIDTLKNTIKMLEASSEQSKLELLSRLERIESNASQTSEDTKVSNQDITATDKANSPADSVSDSKFLAVESEVQQDQLVQPSNKETVALMTKPTEQTRNNSEATRRLQQQAALRDLTQKLELLALDTLSN